MKRVARSQRPQSHSRSHVCLLILATGLVLGTPVAGQISPDEHAQHHPQPGVANPTTGGNVGGTPPGGAMGEMMKERGAGMGGGMGGNRPAAGGGPGPGRMGPPQPDTANPAAGGNAGEATPGGDMGPGGGMMGGGKGPGGGMGPGGGGMMAPKSPSGGCKGGDCGSEAGATPIYPSLMTLPALTPEKRAEIEALASQQMNEGRARLTQGSESLDRATQTGDEAAMQQSVGLMHEALNELEAGIAARRVLSEGKAPRNLALDWFKREMSLASPVVRDESHALLGLSPLHLFTMALLIALALAMLAMYFFKMRRAAALFGRLEPDAGSPPPGSSPPLGGTAGPSAPPEGKTPTSGGSPPPTASPKADSSAPPAAATAPAPAPGGPPPASADKSPNPPKPPAGKPAPPPQPPGAAYDTVFFCHSDTAQAVLLAGSFNDWNPTATPMVRDSRGDWTVSVPLAPGHHEYKFVVDGKWCCEPGCPAPNVQCTDCVLNEFGTMNRTLEAGGKTPPPASAKADSPAPPPPADKAPAPAPGEKPPSPASADKSPKLAEPPAEKPAAPAPPAKTS